VLAVSRISPETASGDGPLTTSSLQRVNRSDLLSRAPSRRFERCLVRGFVFQVGITAIRHQRLSLWSPDPTGPNPGTVPGLVLLDSRCPMRPPDCWRQLVGGYSVSCPGVVRGLWSPGGFHLPLPLLAPRQALVGIVQLQAGGERDAPR
jgi:hypothetical protein